MGTSKYNLEQLGWFNFEKLIQTLLAELIGPGLSTFSGSVDQCRDATFSGTAKVYPSEDGPWSGSWIFQVKHRTYSSQGAAKTRAALKKTIVDEIETITNKYEHDCDNYVFITNCPLTAADKDAMSAKIVGTETSVRNCSVIGESDLDRLLDGHPKVVSVFPQILGLSQLKKLIEWGLHQRSIQFLQAAQNEIATFVATSSYLKAINLLHKQHFCVLSGPPKMGKTCTAYALAASFSAQSFEIWELRNQRDFYDAYNQDEKQLFICDDVFGDIDLRRARRDDWSQGFRRLLAGLGRDHKLVWTAREYILQEALASSKLKEERPELANVDKVTVAVDQLNRLEKGMILYNHAKVAGLPEGVREYLRTAACLEIVDHENFSPESVRQLCTGRLVDFVDAAPTDIDAIRSKVDNFLSRPGDAWKTAYLSAPQGEKLLCIEVMASGGMIPLSDLRTRFENTVPSMRHECESFETSISNSLGTFLRKWSHHGHPDQVLFYHPSMRDLLTELIGQDKQIRVAYLKQLALTEVSALLKQITPEEEYDESSEHRIRLTDAEDIELLRDHLLTTLLPPSTIVDLLSVLTDLRSAIGEENCRSGQRLRSSGGFADVLWMILDTVVPHACTREFWAVNATYNDRSIWSKLFEALRTLLPITKVPSTPEYVPELLRRNTSERSVSYWCMVHAAHSMVPTVVEQCIDMDLRENCRKELEEQVEIALDESESLNLEDDYDDSHNWHDQFGDVYEQCQKYESCFPHDTDIERADDLLSLVLDYPRIEYEPDDDDERRLLASEFSGMDNHILSLFSDL